MKKYFFMSWGVICLHGITESSDTKRQHNPYGVSVLRVTTSVVVEQREPIAIPMPPQQLLPDSPLLALMSQPAMLQAMANQCAALSQENMQLKSEKRTLKFENARLKSEKRMLKSENERLQEDIRGRAATYARLQEIGDEMVKIANSFGPMCEENERLKRENSILQSNVLLLHVLLQAHAHEQRLLM